MTMETSIGSGDEYDESIWVDHDDRIANLTIDDGL